MRICSTTGCSTLNDDSATHCSQCQRLLRNTFDILNPGTILQNYEIIRYVGHGGFGVVYEGRDVQNQTHVAIKETFSPGLISSFQREFDRLRDLRHPNLPLYFEVFISSNNGYLVMEFVEGVSLATLLEQQKKPLLETQVKGFAIQLGSAVSYLHDQNPPFLHRDIKPANILLRPDGVLKLVDFGIAKHERVKSESRTHASQRAFSSIYAPYEQTILEGNVTTRSDIYSFGATLYHLLTNEYPLGGLERQLSDSDPLRAPQHLNPLISPAMNKVILKAMARRVDERFGSIAELTSAIPTADHSAETRSPLRVMVWSFLGIFILLLLASALNQGFALRSKSIDGSDPLVSEGTPIVDVNLTIPATGKGESITIIPSSTVTMRLSTYTPITTSESIITTVPSITLTSTKIVVLPTSSPTFLPTSTEIPAQIMFSAVTEDDSRDIFTTFSNNTDISNLTAQLGEWNWGPNCSPDGQTMLFVSMANNNQDIFSFSLNDGSIEPVINSPFWDYGPSWSPDGTQIAYKSHASTIELRVIDANGENDRLLVSDVAGDWRIGWSPNGQQIVFAAVRDTKRDIFIINLDGTNLRRLTNDEAWDDDPAWSPDGSKIVFSSDRFDQNKEIVMIDLGDPTFTPMRLTFRPGDDFTPDWSSDGSLILFTGNVEGSEHIYTMDSDGGNVVEWNSLISNTNFGVWCP